MGRRALSRRVGRDYGRGMAPRADRASQETEDQVIFVALILTLAFLMFMMSVPIWFSAFIRSLSG